MKTLILIILVALAGCEDSSEQLPDILITPSISTVEGNTLVTLKGEWDNQSKSEYSIGLSYKFKKVGSNKFLDGNTSSHRVTSENKGNFALEDKMNSQIDELQVTYVLKKEDKILLTRHQELKKEGLTNK